MMFVKPSAAAQVNKKQKKDGASKAAKAKQAKKANTGKASFKRGTKKHSSQRKTSSRRSSASTTAPPSSATAILDEDAGSDDGQELQKEKLEYKGYDLERLEIPMEARPIKAGRGEHSYTIYIDGACFDVLLKKKGFYVKRPVNKGCKKTISWSKHASVAAAWSEAKTCAGL